MKETEETTGVRPEDMMSATLIKIEEVGRSMSGGYHVDLTLTNGSIIEATVSEDKLNLLKEKLLEDIFLVVKPLDLPNRYETTCIVFGKAPEYKH